MDQDQADAYIKDSGLLDDFTEENVKSFFRKEFERFESEEITAEQFSTVTDRLLNQHLYDLELKIEESALLTAMQMATEFNEVEKGTQDYNRVVEPIREYLGSNE